MKTRILPFSQVNFQCIDLLNINICLMKSFPRASAEGGSGVGLVLDDWGHLLSHRHPSWSSRSSGWEGMVSCAEWAWTSFLAVSQKQAKVPGPPLQVYEYHLVPWPLPPPAPFSSLGGWRRHATHKTKRDQGALTSVVLDKIPQTLTRENRWSFCCPPDCVSGSFVKGFWKLCERLSTQGARDQQLDWECGGDSTWRRREGQPGFFTGGKNSSWVYRKRLKGTWRRKLVHPQRSSRLRDSWAERNNGSLCLLPGLPFAQHHPGTWGPKGSYPGATGSLGLSRLGGHRRGLGHCSWWRETFL